MSDFWNFFFKCENDDSKEDRLLTIMRQNHDRVTISRSGVVRVNLENEDVKNEIDKHIQKLKELETLDRHAL
ncbi:hypothetical protein SD340_003661 [Vibrio fluvialis]|uniref:hypothetical protein n=1 Tax=Vibrio fluvialis TaxID=676 RepID=UPI000646E36B|nr:hypothetical protein [Vibrio fluvialis]EKO3399264.1 hypothetical protein [Vibrio fluvialis]EKO3982985.1 hypothetical protein [Vibrio fluvialis]ELD1797644.1 hypothetical protein [Vibrio fluvialis]ELH7949057.1 hypothetical protein [Vibrio fluvialis]ELU8401764.1 hypothetical protein [Vibrio fluvialis]